MTEYGKAIVEAAARAGATAFWRQTYKDADGMVMVAAGATWRETEHLYRAALLAAIDRLIARGASDRMVYAALRADDPTPRGEFDAMLRALRAEIEEGEIVEAARERYRLQDPMAKARDRAILLCKDPVFQRWIAEKLPHIEACGKTEEDKAAVLMRAGLEIASRSQIATNEQAYKRFLVLEDEFKQYEAAK